VAGYTACYATPAEGRGVKRVLLARPDGIRLYELSDDEYARLDHLLDLIEPPARGEWVARFLGERIAAQSYPPGTRGPPNDLPIDRAIGGNQFTWKWGRKAPRDEGH
jgi:hypothetical protein